ncbi:hypothetical protein K474DRAFT_1659074 [Panus rudis PR-1116 ss-1]|nr:hypothetical protein K474DRAFT_1659074 [Panus rudis PR-1116 ss-1]
MVSIEDLSPEIIEQILLELDPLDVAAFSQTCREYASQIYDPSNELFWRKLYLNQPLDDPRECITELGYPVDSKIQWRQRLQRIIRARTIVENPDRCHPDERTTIVETLLSLALELPPTHGEELSLNSAYLVTLLRGGKFIDSPLWVPSPEEKQLRARLHTYFGLTTLDFRHRRRTETRGTVYALRNYKRENFYGPFLPDESGRVDWELTQCIHHVMSMHIVPPSLGDAGFVTYAMSLPFCLSLMPPDNDLDNVEDWAGITGQWLCSFCFIDHRELLAYNHISLEQLNVVPSDVPLDTSLFDDPEFEEIFRTIIVNFQLDRSEKDPDHPTRPILHFSGKIQNEYRMFGWVKVTPDDCIRWHFHFQESGEPGNALWSSEGVQIGGVRSMYGVLGVWTTVEHDPHDPVGPFWLRKNLDYEPELSTTSEAADSDH